VPDARLDDLMISYASDGGGVGPHFDSYDVFLLQVQGGAAGASAAARHAPRADVPLKILATSSPRRMAARARRHAVPAAALGHDGVAEGECMTCSIGFRAAARDEVGREVLQRLLDARTARRADAVPRSVAAAHRRAGAHPGDAAGLRREAVGALVENPKALACALGEWLSEPKPRCRSTAARRCATARRRARPAHAHALRRRPRVHQRRVVPRAGPDASLMRQLADRRRLHARSGARERRRARAARRLGRGRLAARDDRRRTHDDPDEPHADRDAARVPRRVARRPWPRWRRPEAASMAERRGFADWPLNERGVVDL
jgi:50S ribosomal protein L16 3-hydroxylase